MFLNDYKLEEAFVSATGFDYILTDSWIKTMQKSEKKIKMFPFAVCQWMKMWRHKINILFSWDACIDAH